MKKIVTGAIAILTVFAVLALVACGGSGITLAQYEEVETGMTLDQVIEIFGGNEGTIMSETEMFGIRTEIRSWDGRGSVGANLNITFQGNEGEDLTVVSKAQIGLR